jgi:MFS superfamily sulfate permease-like transporter
MGLGRVGADPWFGLGALAVLAALYATRLRSLSGIAVLLVAVIVSLAMGTADVSGLTWDPALPAFAWPTFDDFKAAAATALLPQLALTLSNAVLATAAIAAVYFPADGEKLGAPRLAASTGLLNLVLAPFGAVPMCHGSGGLVAQYGFGARTWGAPALFGVFCLALGVGLGAGGGAVLALIPIGVVGAMLAVTGAEIAISKRFLDIKPSCRVVVVVTGVACVALNVAAGLAIGLAAEVARTLYLRHTNSRTT